MKLRRAGRPNGLIDKAQYTELVTVVILSAFVPTLIAHTRPTVLDGAEEEALGEEDLTPTARLNAAGA